jgi:hypothetical protein
VPSHSRPLALGLLHIAPGTPAGARTRARVALALRANRDGYGLVETLEFGTSTLKDNLQFDSLEDLATRLDAQALVIAGPLDAGRIHEIADHLRLVVVEHDDAASG